MSDEVRASYNDLEQVSQRFTKAQNEVQQMLQRVRSSMDPLESGSWIGRGFDAFQSEMNGEVLPAVTRLQNALGEAASTTNNIVQVMQSADEDASGPFNV